MRVLGYDIVICPFCSQLYKKQIIASSNSIGSSYFSDGYIEGPFIPVLPNIIKCVNDTCGQFFHVNTLKKIGRIDLEDEFYDPLKWETAYALEGFKMAIKELKEALDTDICKCIENEIIVRTLLLWRINDYFRKDDNHILIDEEKDFFNTNIDRLIELKENNTEMKEELFIAELFREKADFATCIRILNDMNNENKNKKTIKEKIFSQAKIKKNVVFNVDLIAIKKEYKCNNCNESLILFDLEKLDTPLRYKHFLCRIDNKVFNDSLKIQNPVKEYRLNKLQKLFKLKKPHVRFINNTKLACPFCKNQNIEEFNPELQNCIKCGIGNYETIKWFE